MACTCKVRPGKFEGEGVLTFMAYQQMCLGNVDESVGRYDFFKAPFNFDADQSVVKAAKDYGYCETCIENHDNRKSYGFVLHEDDNGFVYGRVLLTEDGYSKAVAEAEQTEDEEA